MNFLKISFVPSIFILSSFLPLYSQEEEALIIDDELHKIYIAAGGGIFHASKKTASYYEGTNSYGITNVISIQNHYNQIYNLLGQNFNMGGFPANSKYRLGLDLNLELGFWVSDYTALTLGVEFVQLKYNEVFTLEADNPANLSGDPIIYPEQVIGSEQRFQFNLGLHHDVGANEKYMTFFEWGINFNALKPIKNEIVIENQLRYSLMYQPNTFIQAPKTEIGYGAFAGMGCRFSFPKNMAMDIGLKAYFQKIKLGSFSGFTFSELLFMRIVYR